MQLTANLMLLWLAAVPLMGSPGPATMSLAAIGAAYGARAGLPYLAGIIAGTFAVLLMIATGVTGVILAVPALIWLITVVAAAYILFLAYRIATAPVMSAGRPAESAPSFPGGFFLAVANPKAFAAIGAVYSGNRLQGNDLLLDAVGKILALLAVIIVVNLAWLVFGSVFARVLQNPRAGRVANILFAGLLVLSVLLAARGLIGERVLQP
jgi:threonine/homoserine/homoserine lactone efflux protein